MDDREFLDRAVEVIAAGDSSDSHAVSAPHFSDPLVDVFSVAASAAGGAVRAPDPDVERNLAAVDAVAAASSLMIMRVRPVPRWWRALVGPAVATDQSGAVAIVPTGRKIEVFRAHTRHASLASARSGLNADAVTIAEDAPPAQSWTALVRWSLRSSGRPVWLLVLLSAVGGVAGLLLPLTTAALFSYAIPWGDVTKTVWILVGFAIASVGAAIVFFARNLLVIRLRDASDGRLSPGIMAHTLRLPASFFRSRSTGDILNRVMSAEQARQLVDDGVPALVVTSAFGVVNLAFIYVINVALGLWLTLIVAVIVTVVVVFQLRARAVRRDLLETRSRSDAMLMSLIHAIVPIRVSGAEARAMARWADLQARAIATLALRMSRGDRGQPLAAVGPILVSTALVSGVIVIGAGFTASQFMPAYAAVIQLTVAMTAFSINVVLLSEVGPVLARALPITAHEVERPSVRRPPGPLGGEIALTDVVFGYDPTGPPQIDGLTLEIPPGQFIALVGSSGSGKSTTMRLILGFEEPWSGVVSYDRKDLSELDVTAVRRQLGTVLQSSRPYGGTFRECICGPLQIPDDEVWSVLGSAGLEDAVRRQPAGLDSPIGTDGSEISGGQRQRLMIARALASRPRVVLLDEATSALDNATQRIVMDTVLGMPVTRVVIAHRLSTIEQADRVVVLDAGRIVEDGRPDELRALGGHFARLAERQAL